MELRKVEIANHRKITTAILGKKFSTDELEEIIENLSLLFEEGGELYAFFTGDTPVGCFVASPYSEDAKQVEELVLDEFYFLENLIDDSSKAEIASLLKIVKKEFKPFNMEIVSTQEINWMGDILLANGYICELIKLEKILPNKKNLNDVVELITDCIPMDRVNDLIIQVLLEKEDEYKTEIIENDEDIPDIMEGDWNPIMVVLSFEPMDQKINEIIDASNQLINWDDYEIIFSI
ncbi:MAG: hypothetical protein INQ03_10095 [Candidatus Heimdallarchaeota archaeon]|nr:hypothetical protein [Candidatus Heimdallarchaeota archaeon]